MGDFKILVLAYLIGHSPIETQTTFQMEGWYRSMEECKSELLKKMPDGRYGVYADKFKNKKRVMTPGGKHAKELKKVYKNKKDANDYMAAIMIAKGGG